MLSTLYKIVGIVLTLEFRLCHCPWAKLRLHCILHSRQQESAAAFGSDELVIMSRRRDDLLGGVLQYLGSWSHCVNRPFLLRWQIGIISTRRWSHFIDERSRAQENFLVLFTRDPEAAAHLLLLLGWL